MRVKQSEKIKKSELEAYRDKIRAGIAAIDHGPGLELISRVTDLCLLEEEGGILTDWESFALIDILYRAFELKDSDLKRLRLAWLMMERMCQD